MIIAHHINGESVATIHCVDDRDWERYATRAIAMLRNLSPNGIKMVVRMRNRERIAYR
jgi:hypothetical protein